MRGEGRQIQICINVRPIHTVTRSIMERWKEYSRAWRTGQVVGRKALKVEMAEMAEMVEMDEMAEMTGEGTGSVIPTSN